MTRVAVHARCQCLWPPDAAPCPLDGVLRQLISEASWSYCRRIVESGKVSVGGVVVTEPRYIVGPNTPIEINPGAPRLDRIGVTPVRLVHVDSQIVVADKPSGISTVPFEPGERGTFDEQVRRGLSNQEHRRLAPLEIVHRIDKETSGLLVFARTIVAKRHLKQQFRFHTNHRAYLALAWGTVRPQTIQSRLVVDRGDGRRGSTNHPSLGQLAITHVEVVERLGKATLLRCRLETGRTHQIRIHLAETGHPLLGERVYARQGTQPPFEVPRLMLHAAELGFVHPTREVRLDFRSSPPSDFVSISDRLRSAGQTGSPSQAGRDPSDGSLPRT